MPYIEQYVNAGSTTSSDYFLISRNNTYFKLSQSDLYNEIAATVGGGITLGSIDEHTDVDTSSVAPTLGQALIWDNTNWVPGAAGVATFAALTDVALSSITTGDVSVWNGTDWVNRARTGTQNYVLKSGASSTQVDSQIRDDATGVGIGKAPSSYRLDVAGTINMDEAGIIRVAGNKYIHYTHGSQTSVNNYSTFCGYASFPTNDGLSNSGFGANIGALVTTATRTTILGANSGNLITTHSRNTLIGETSGRVLAATDCTFLGNESGYNTNANYNTFLGAGTNVSSSNLTDIENVGVGWTAAQFVHGASRGNIFLGPYSGRQTAGTVSYSLGIGYEAHVTANNQVVIGGKLDTSAYLDFILGYSLVPAVTGSGATQQTIRIRPGGTYYVASHTDEGGHNLSIEAGLNYGDGSAGATKGDLLFKTSSVTGSGTTLGTATTRMTIQGGTGYIILNGLPTSSAGLPSGAIYSNLGILTIV